MRRVRLGYALNDLGGGEVTSDKEKVKFAVSLGRHFRHHFVVPAESDQCASKTMSGWQKGLTPDEPAPLRDLRPRAADDDRRRRGGGNGAPGSAVITRTKPQTKKPSLYRVLLLNDDYTPMEFVVHVLERFFNKDREAATRIMLHVHHHGIGECGIFTYEVAETKVTQVMDFARKHQHPLQCVMEKK
jgi:ATP-dependent Clp protease adaptor protein ClpS